MPDSLESLDLPAYRSLPDSALSRLAGDVRSRLPGGWEAGSDRFGVWARQAVVGLRFRLLPGGVHRIGLSDDELAAAVAIAPQPQMTVSEMMPVRDVKLQALLVGDLPITQAVARQFVADLDTGYPDQPAMLPGTRRWRSRETCAVDYRARPNGRHVAGRVRPRCSRGARRYRKRRCSIDGWHGR